MGPREQIKNALAEEARCPYGWLSDGLYKSASISNGNSQVNVNGGSISLDDIVDIVEAVLEDGA